MATRRHDTTDAGAPHKYFAMIPHTISRGRRGRGLSLPARWLYVYFKSVACENGECTASTTTIAKEAQLGRGTIPAAKEELVKAGLIRITTRQDGYHSTDKIRIVDLWPENMQEFADCSPDEQPMADCSPDEQPMADCSPDEQQCSPHEQPLSPSNDMSLEDSCSPHELGCSPHEPKKIFLKKIQEKKEDTPLPPSGGPAGAVLPTRQRRPKPSKSTFPADPYAQVTLKASILDDQFKTWATQKGITLDLEKEWDAFVCKALAKGYEYVSWRHAFMNWLTSPYQQTTGSHSGVGRTSTTAQAIANFVQGGAR